ncbi:positive-acting master sulfur regulatory [Aspergillus steynii IBT 23096]|uniref:Positive-acting master sulfur regulatory n=1 Tax=Aspergillus steynii IBT 23096 TaxID=1392250 RepID=A0A2I2FXZ5_9EURO|nr:positive-acting master sulfur regulatory [Aspergillus steynii IBT 23096]PLB45505.1 positive-acting master sulfur regulatory [Aspergillus steynii IBT 23096]
MSDEQIARQAASSFDRLENFNFLLSRHDPALAKSRQYSFDADSAGLAPPLQNLNMDYDQTEGMGGLSVSSYDSIEDERSPIDVRGYPYATGNKSINYTLPDQMLSYSAHPIYPPISYGPPDDLGHAPGALTPSDVSSSISPPNGQIGNTKYSTQISGDHIVSALGQEEHVRHAAEEDRRRRNTAASARFRMKKKQREQTLERTVRETTEKNASLEARVAQLEMENRWLKNLLTEKHDASSSRMPPPSEPPASSQKNNSAGSGQKHIQPKKKGVGTDN